MIDINAHSLDELSKACNICGGGDSYMTNHIDPGMKHRINCTQPLGEMHCPYDRCTRQDNAEYTKCSTKIVCPSS